MGPGVKLQSSSVAPPQAASGNLYPDSDPGSAILSCHDEDGGIWPRRKLGPLFNTERLYFYPTGKSIQGLGHILFSCPTC